MRVRTERHWAMLVACAVALACGGTDDLGDGAGGDLDAAANATSRQGGARLTVGGTLSGLSGDSVALQDNGSYDTLTLSANGTFTFAKPLKNRSTYAVTVSRQPSGQTCAVANGTGTIAGANVTDVAVTCSPNPSPVTYYTVGGTISGLSGTVVLNDGGENLTLTADGSFTFSTALANGSSYSVTVGTPPPGETCAVANGTGTIAGANVTSVVVSCSPSPSPSQVAMPTFNPRPGTYEFTTCIDNYGCYFAVTLSDDTPGATIYYTSDGSVPTVAGGVPTGTTTLYNGEIDLWWVWDMGCFSETVTISAIAIANGTSSDVAYGTYTLGGCSPLS